MTQLTFFTHASTDELLEIWTKSGGKKPLLITELCIEHFHADIDQQYATENVFEAFQHFWSQSQVSAIVTGETSIDTIWCMYRGFVWLFAMIQFSSPGYESDRYIFDVRSHFDSDFVRTVEDATATD